LSTFGVESCGGSAAVEPVSQNLLPESSFTTPQQTTQHTSPVPSSTPTPSTGSSSTKRTGCGIDSPRRGAKIVFEFLLSLVFGLPTLITAFIAATAATNNTTEAGTRPDSSNSLALDENASKISRGRDLCQASGPSRVTADYVYRTSVSPNVLALEEASECDVDMLWMRGAGGGRNLSPRLREEVGSGSSSNARLCLGDGGIKSAEPESDVEKEQPTSQVPQIDLFQKCLVFSSHKPVTAKLQQIGVEVTMCVCVCVCVCVCARARARVCACMK
jgi:hypothetical protein